MTSGPEEQWSQDGRGSIRWQDPATATPRPPTVAEARQRDKMQKEREAAEEWARLQQETRDQRAATGKKVLMGSVAVVGVVGVIALGYHLLHKEEIAASCVKDGTNEVVPDSYCSSGHSSSGGTFIYLGSPYRYYYGGNNGGVGTIARGGTLEMPKGTTARTKSGTSISRGGFGSSSSYGKSSGS
ncbi:MULTISPECIES: hypothetical protein [Mycobacterium]|uniref:hypothetical protein n=1 Tax=Mycobacterium TaxID=1763 RepID=UPI0009F68F81|nr:MULTISPECIES: hypothetical protein [Mycobacterium]MCG7610059.1 hypothetical protein [Mycobacterium sp. CnD-18-1]